MNSISHNFLLYQANFILDIQNIFGENNDFLRKVSKYSDPSYAISILFPVFCSLDTKVGFYVLLVSSVTEWANILLKWFLAENRPYWWVAEAKVHVPLRQTDITCETGAGSPSGHVMGAAALSYVFLRWLTCWMSEIVPPNKKRFRNAVRIFLWMVYLIIVCLVTLSRVNIAAHFIHQCLLGAIIGLLISMLLVKDAKWTLCRKFFSLSKWKMILLAFLGTSVAVACYFLHQVLGLDPGWSIKLAFKWCERPHLISVNTTPLYSIVRDCGCFFAMAIASPVKERLVLRLYLFTNLF
ncbi:unnamed protein product [Nezara viridula]|uniref:glucose-6-phosphatase n=1 Tax=Nezara viridula TaxID=85310 RepID=A0A9P0MSH7_NEZVI|nr:unnamed protein product [Nezara viridula]